MLLFSPHKHWDRVEKNSRKTFRDVETILQTFTDKSNAKSVSLKLLEDLRIRANEQLAIVEELAAKELGDSKRSELLNEKANIDAILNEIDSKVADLRKV